MKKRMSALVLATAMAASAVTPAITTTKKEIKSIFNEKCKGKDSEADDYEYTRGFKYLTYSADEHTGPTRHHFIICNEPNVKAIK